MKALQIVDKGGVRHFIADTSGRELFQVQLLWLALLVLQTQLLLQSVLNCCSTGEGQGPSDQYTVFPGHFCSCHSFFWDVVSRKHAVYVSMLAPMACSLGQAWRCHAVSTDP